MLHAAQGEMAVENEFCTFYHQKLAVGAGNESVAFFHENGGNPEKVSACLRRRLCRLTEEKP